MKHKFTYIALIFVLSAPALSGQPKNMPVHDASSVEYDGLVKSYSELTAREDDLEARLAAARELFAADEGNRDRHANSILILEMELFQLRDSLKTLSAAIGWSEPSGDINAAGNAIPVRPGTGESPNIVYNQYFRSNMKPEDYALLCEKQEIESGISALIGEIRDNYDRISALDSLYRSADRKEADSLFFVLESALEKGRQLSDEMSADWNGVFESKIYLYNLLLDKAGRSGTLADMERRMLNVRLRMDESRGRYMYDPVASYPFQKSLLIRYETVIASYAGLGAAADSLRKASAKVMDLDYYFMPLVTLEERLFLDYSDIQIARQAKYDAGNPVPPTEIHPRGTIYRVLLGVYGMPQPVNTFRGVYPLSVERKADRRYYYYAGGFRTFAEAATGAARTKKAGLANSKVVLWQDGEYDPSPAAPPTAGGKHAQTLYRIEIPGTDTGLPEEVRNVLSASVPDKEISRVVDGETGEVKFTVGSFGDIVSAEEVVRELNSTAPSLEIKIFSIP